jgi:O-antigen/teichoic acid export membrane protein
MSTVRARLVRGLVTGLLHEAVVVVLSFVTMIALVRLLTPAEFGQAAAVVGVLGFIGAFRGAMFVEHALQHGQDDQPDWDRYVAVVGLVQIGLCGVTLLVSLAFELSVTFSAMSPLLQVAALGVLLDWPAQVASVKLRRDLRFDRLKLIASISTLLRVTSAVALAWLGFGAMALVISANVLAAAPLACSFLFVERWRPRGSWLFIPRVEDMRPMLRFGVQQIGVALLVSLRTAAESLVLTAHYGAARFGLINRAHALYQSTIGRVGIVFVDTAYPLLPLEKGDARRYAQRASRFLQAALVLSVPGAVFIALEGATVSRVLYGQKWLAANPYLAAAAVAVAATNVVSTSSRIVMGVGRMRRMLIVEMCASIGGLAALMTANVSDPATYLWTLAMSQVVAAGLALSLAAPFLERDWMQQALWPAIAASVAGACAVVTVRNCMPVNGVLELPVVACVFASVGLTVLAVTAPALVAEVIRTRKALTWGEQPPAQSHAQA